MRTDPRDVERRACVRRMVALAGWATSAAGWATSAAVRAEARGPTLQVGPGRRIRSLAQAARIAGPGTRIEVDAGLFAGDVATWHQEGLRLRSVGGRVLLRADGAAAEGKAIWVVRARDVSVEGFDFEGAAVPSRNGAGIRLESGSLTVRDCSFVRNEMGLLTNNEPGTELDVEDCEFAHNHRPDGHNHGLYAGTIGRLSVTGCYFHHGHLGHLLKSRAAVNRIAYNRLTDEADGRASYELEFPNGGLAHVIGNILQQGPRTENPHVVSYGAEGYRWPVNEIHLVHNTLVDDRVEPGVWLRVQRGDVTVRAIGNLLVGEGGWEVGADAVLAANVRMRRDGLHATGAAAYRPRHDLAAIDRAPPTDADPGLGFRPDREYRHPRGTSALPAPLAMAGALRPAP